MTGIITAIFVAPTRHSNQTVINAVQVKARKGIVGDRFFGFRNNQPSRNLTFIEAEIISEFNRTFQQSIPLNATRRNFITQGIRLNNLVGRIFRVGDVLCRGVELCEPCPVMARQLPPCPLSKTQIITAFTGKGGLRAEALSDGIVQLGDGVVIVDDTPGM